MEDLTKQQIVLLTLLVSFVTSLATGIITVSLMDQGDIGITQIVNKVVERTVEKPTVAAAIVPAEPTLTKTTAQVSKSLIQFKPTNGSAESVLGLGLVLSPDGLILTNKSAISLSDAETLGKGITAVLPNGQEVPIQVIQSEVSGDIAFVVALLPTSATLTPVTVPSNLSSIKLGEAIYALSGKQAMILEEGIIKKTPITPEDSLETSITSKNILIGSPLFTLSGQMIGFKTSSLKDSSSFYPLPALKSIAPQISR